MSTMKYDIHAMIAAGTGVGGAVIAEAAQSPAVTWSAVAISLIGMVSLWLRLHYNVRYRRIRAENKRLRAVIDDCPLVTRGTAHRQKPQSATVIDTATVDALASEEAPPPQAAPVVPETPVPEVKAG